MHTHASLAHWNCAENNEIVSNIKDIYIFTHTHREMKEGGGEMNNNDKVAKLHI